MGTPPWQAKKSPSQGVDEPEKPGSSAIRFLGSGILRLFESCRRTEFRGGCMTLDGGDIRDAPTVSLPGQLIRLALLWSA